MFKCTACQKEVSLRKAPEWFRSFLPYASVLVGETTAEAQQGKLKPEGAIAIHCYHCGASLPLDGKQRNVLCSYCGKQCMVPDEVWLRLHPIEMTRSWYILLDLDKNAIALPADISGFIDIAALPGANRALLWEDSDGYCLGVVAADSLFRWIRKDINSSSYARLFYVASSDTLWVLDQQEEIVYAFDATTGKEILQIENEDHESDTISVVDHRGAVVFGDDTILVYRNWETGPSKSLISELIGRAGPHVLTQEELDALNQVPRLAEMRRFDRKGNRTPLWPGQRDEDLDHSIKDWNSLKDLPVLLPDEALLEAEQEALYLVEPELAIVARFDRSGYRTDLVRPIQKEISSITDCAIDRDGSVLIGFGHRQKINHETYLHVGRIHLDGRFEVLAGPHAPEHTASLGTAYLRLSIDDAGSIHVCGGDFNNLRVLSSDGSTIWRSVWTIMNDPAMADELNEARGQTHRHQ